VFFVDDEPLVLESFMSMPAFLECGYISAGHCFNPSEAAGMIEKINPDVVFTDLKMPRKNGVELMDDLKRSGYAGEFVMVSAYGEFEEARQFFKMDGFDYLVKPVSEQDLQALLEKLSGRLSIKIPLKKSKPEIPGSLLETTSGELNRITAYLYKNIALKHSLESIGERFHLNPNYICNLFSRYLGTTFITYMTDIRMTEAARLLKTTQKAVKEISALCGYGDYFYFCRVFRDVYACTPTEYREAVQ